MKRHPVLFRLLISALVITLSAWAVLAVTDYPALTAEGAAARLARENGVNPAPILMIRPSECTLSDPYRGSWVPDAWALGCDGEQYQIAQLSRTAMDLLWSPWREEGAIYTDPLYPFQVVTPTESVPLQYRLAMARKGHSPKGAFRTELFSPFLIYTEYLALVFADPSVVRVEAQQQSVPKGQDPDWTHWSGTPIPGAPLIGGVWEVRYLGGWNNEQEVLTRIVGYDRDGAITEAVFAPPPPFA